MTGDLFGNDWKALWNGAEVEKERGAVFTKPEIVSLILDLVGYDNRSTRLASRRLLEPSCGDGAFLREIVNRLILSERALTASVDWSDSVLDDAIRAVDINPDSVNFARELVVQILRENGCADDRAKGLASCWVFQTDFLLCNWENAFDVIVGNPPYVRIESLPKGLLHLYRSMFDTTSDRADLYVAFVERGLQLLSNTGRLAFITANRFAKNQYGTALRRLISAKYHVRWYVNLEHTQPFLEDVSAYPAVIVVDRDRGEPTLAATLSDLEEGTLDAIRQSSLNAFSAPLVSKFDGWYVDGTPWISTSFVELEVLRDLENKFPTLEESGPGTKVGIGVATGADSVFIVENVSGDLELSRRLPLVLANDVRTGKIQWSGHFVLNPFSDSGDLVDLDRYPGLKKHLMESSEILGRRHVAKARPAAWYRTIDRIWPSLATTPKLLIPDIQPQKRPVIVLDEGLFYPHHNLYWITSSSWDLLALMAVLRSSIVAAQVRAHSVQMRGGSLRWQAQTLRKLRIPAFAQLDKSTVIDLRRVALSGDQVSIDSVVTVAYLQGGMEPNSVHDRSVIQVKLAASF